MAFVYDGERENERYAAATGFHPGIWAFACHEEESQITERAEKRVEIRFSGCRVRCLFDWVS